MPNPLTTLVTHVTETVRSGGSYVAPGNRILLQGLALSLHAQTILETGYDTGCTTMALAMTGAPRVVAVENHFEHAPLKVLARQRLAAFPNVELVDSDALLYLLTSPSEGFDLLFIDDCHEPGYLAYELQEACRLVRQGGCLVFHDTLSLPLEAVVRAGCPPGWEIIQLPCIQGWEQYSGDPALLGYDFGLMIVRRPYGSPPCRTADNEDVLTLLTRLPGIEKVFRSRVVELNVGTETGFHMRLEFDGTTTEVTSNAAIHQLAHEAIQVFRAVRENPFLDAPHVYRLDQVRQFLRAYGAYCSVLASQEGTARRAAGTFGHKVFSMPPPGS